MRHIRAFTLVELVITIAVVSILAAATYASFYGVNNRAVDAAARSDLSVAVTKLETIKAQTRAYPVDIQTAQADFGLSAGGDNLLQYTTVPGGFCLSSFSLDSDVAYNYSTTTSRVMSGMCAGHTKAVVTTLAGMGTRDISVDGTGLAARFYDTFTVAVNDEGVIFVNDWPCIRKITPDGNVSHFVGLCSDPAGSSFADGVGADARFIGPYGMTFTSDGSMYVADRFRIRKVTPMGEVTTFAGSGVSGYADGVGTSATFGYNRFIVSDNSDNLYVTGGSCVRKITPAAVVTTFVGSCTESGDINANGTSARLYSAIGIAVDADNNIYVADRNTIKKITPSADVSTLAGAYGVSDWKDGTGSTARLSATGMCTASNGDLLFIDKVTLIDGGYFAGLRKVTTGGIVTTIAGAVTPNYLSTNYDGVGMSAKFNAPWGCAVAPDGTIYIADEEGSNIRKVVIYD